MIPGEFEYQRATSAEEAVRLLAGNDGAKLLAGGHSLLPMMKLRLAVPTVLVDIRGIDALSFVRHDDGDLVIGSMTTHADVAGSELVTAGHAALAEAAASIGDVQVRNLGTIGGSLAHADPAADYAAVALALEAQIEVLGPDGGRSIAAADFFAGLLTTSLAPAELITAVRFPGTSGAISGYEKFAQPASGFAIVGVAAEVKVEDGSCTAARIAATGISDRPVRLSEVEAALVGASLDDESIAAAAEHADAGLTDVRSDMYAAEDYRRHLLGVMVRRAVARARP